MGGAGRRVNGKLKHCGVEGLKSLSVKGGRVERLGLSGWRQVKESGFARNVFGWLIYPPVIFREAHK
jgi:hypothetical protein